MAGEQVGTPFEVAMLAVQLSHGHRDRPARASAYFQEAQGLIEEARDWLADYRNLTAETHPV